jgi:membrane protein implicated in regulation of membrane protease activity
MVFRLRLSIAPLSQVGVHRFGLQWQEEVAMSSALLWMIAALVAVGVEIVTVDLTFGLIAVGAGSAAVAAALGAPIWLQGVIGVGVALAGIAFVRPFALRHLRRSTPSTRTGVDALTGAEGRALSAVTVVDGRISLRGEIWSARLDVDVTSVPIDPGTEVLVTRIDGATALVYPIDPR